MQTQRRPQGDLRIFAFHFSRGVDDGVEDGLAVGVPDAVGKADTVGKAPMVGDKQLKSVVPMSLPG